jgi:hypothetical protein
MMKSRLCMVYRKGAVAMKCVGRAEYSRVVVTKDGVFGVETENQERSVSA